MFLAGLSACSRNSINVFLKGPSSIGKTYVTMEALKYFPQSDIWMLGGLSPTALVHDYGVFFDPIMGEEVDFDKRPNKRDFKDKASYKITNRQWQKLPPLLRVITHSISRPDLNRRYLSI